MAEKRGKRSRTVSEPSLQREIKKTRREEDWLGLSAASESLDTLPSEESNIESNLSDTDTGLSARPKRQAKICNYYESSDEEVDNAAKGLTLEDAMKALRITNEDLDKFFADLHLPIYLTNPPPNHGKKRIYASSMTPELMELAGWRFLDLQKYSQPDKVSYTVDQLYIPVTKNKSPVPWTEPPMKLTPKDVPQSDSRGRIQDDVHSTHDGERDDSHQNQESITTHSFETPRQLVSREIPKSQPDEGTAIGSSQREEGARSTDSNPLDNGKVISHVETEAKARKPHDNIRKAAWFSLLRLTKDTLHSRYPDDWKNDHGSWADVRPEMPPDFRDVLYPPPSPISRNSPDPSSSLEVTPIKPIRSKRDTVPRLAINDFPVVDPMGFPIYSIPEVDEDALPDFVSTPPNNTLPLNPNTNISITEEETGQFTRRIPKPGRRYEFAESLVEEHNWKVIQSDAKLLEQHIIDAQWHHDIRESKRSLCQRLGAVDDLADMGFEFVPRELLEHEDRTELKGNAARSEHAHVLRKTAMALNERWVNFSPITPGANETTIERDIASLFVGLFCCDGFEETADEPILFPIHLQAFSTVPQPDFGVRGGYQEWAHWPASLRPVVASGDNKTPNRLGSKTEAQLACNSHSTLILDILLYLDTRPTANALLPSWMWHYAWANTDQGFVVYIHFPGVHHPRDGRDWSWRLNSLVLTREYENVWSSDSRVARLRAKAAFDLMVSHTSWVHKQLLDWSKGGGTFREGGIMNQLIARARYDAEEYDWVLKEAKLALLGKAKCAVEDPGSRPF